MKRPRVILFGVLCVVCVVATAAYVAFKLGSRQPVAERPDASATASANPGELQTILDQPHLMFVDTADPSHPRLAVASLDAPDNNRFVTGTPCDRVYFAGGSRVVRWRRGALLRQPGAD